MRPARLSPARAILYGTLVVGTLDIVDAFVFFGLRSGATPVRILQSIASGWLGRAAYTGGAGAAALGAITHYFIAFGIVATYFVVSRRVAVLTRHSIACGIVYGLLVYLFMNRVVIPLSAIGAATRLGSVFRARSSRRAPRRGDNRRLGDQETCGSAARPAQQAAERG
jgi:hypothetical protein